MRRGSRCRASTSHCSRTISSRTARCSFRWRSGPTSGALKCSTRRRAERERMARTLFQTAPPRNIKVYLFLAFSAVLLALFIFTNILIRRLTEETERTSRLFANLCATASYPAAEDTTIQNILSGVIEGINFPIVLTDVSGTPRAWKEVGVDQILVPAASLDSMFSGHVPSPVIKARID